jgi:hypothetical protein
MPLLSFGFMTPIQRARHRRVIDAGYRREMTFALWAASGYCGIAIALHLASITIAIIRCRSPRREYATPSAAPAVTIIRPVCGLDNFVEATLASTFALDIRAMKSCSAPRPPPTRWCPWCRVCSCNIRMSRQGS